MIKFQRRIELYGNTIVIYSFQWKAEGVYDASLFEEFQTPNSVSSVGRAEILTSA